MALCGTTKVTATKKVVRVRGEARTVCSVGGTEASTDQGYADRGPFLLEITG